MKLDLNKINSGIADRSDVFYWQTDRKVDPVEAGQIWADRHRYFTDSELIERANTELKGKKVVSILPLNLDSQTNLGNVNSVRVGKLDSGEEVIMRCFPKGIKNGYFHVEAAAADMARKAGLPSYRTLSIHEFGGGNDFAFHILEKLPGNTMKVWLESNSGDEATLLTEVGRMMANLHKIKVVGFGPFDNDKAKSGELIGLHHNYAEALRAGLSSNLDILVDEGIIRTDQIEAINCLFADNNPLLTASNAVLIHNDFADWNILTDGKAITGILDWDECVGGDPVSDIACWSTFFEPERLNNFLDGYWQVVDKPDNFQDKFELLRLRYTLSKMTLRIRRYSWDPSDFMREKIETGKVHLAQSMYYFGV